MDIKIVNGAIYGTLLGDSYIHKTGWIGCKHIQRHKDLILTKKETIEAVASLSVNVKLEPERIDKSGVYHQPYWDLWTNTTEYGKRLRELFYPEGIKVVTENILNHLTPQGIAWWYQDDGYVTLVGRTKGYIKNRRVELCTDSYTLDEVELIQWFLKTKIGCKSSLILTAKKKPRIRFYIKDAQSYLFPLIFPFMSKSMYYKMDLQYPDMTSYHVTEEYHKIAASIAPTIS